MPGGGCFDWRAAAQQFRDGPLRRRRQRSLWNAGPHRCGGESGRTWAIVLLLVRLGLRAGEVIRLRIDDIDWTRGCVLVRAGKTHRERSLPLSQEVGDALVLYLRESRPGSVHRELFLRWRPPFRPIRKSVSICTLVQKLLKRAGISVHRPGAHVSPPHPGYRNGNQGGPLQSHSRCTWAWLACQHGNLREARSRLAVSSCDALAGRCKVNLPDLLLRVECYVGLRRAIGCNGRSCRTCAGITSSDFSRTKKERNRFDRHKASLFRVFLT